jgi:hypothetical protein
MPSENVTSLSDFLRIVSDFRSRWSLRAHEEIWFRGESTKFDTHLRPKLYRPHKGLEIKPVPELLKIENRLYEEFQRLGFQLCEQMLEQEDEYWDWYFLMQHHGAATRLLDWTDGALIALHFASKAKGEKDKDNRVVYLLAPDRLQDQLKTLPEIQDAKEHWKVYVENHPSYKSKEDEWEYAYLPGDDDDLRELSVPKVPLLLEFPHITRRVAAQRSRFMVFGTDPFWLSEEFKKTGVPLEEITIDGNSARNIRLELRDSGVSESVIFPDFDGLGREMYQLWEDEK